MNCGNTKWYAMKTTHSFSIDFLVRKCKEDRKSGFVYARITIDVERAEISLKEKIELINWDTKSERAKGKTSEVKALNEHIDIQFWASWCTPCVQEMPTINFINDTYGGSYNEDG